MRVTVSKSESFLHGYLKGRSDWATNRAKRPQMRMTVSKNEFFFHGYLKGWDMTENGVLEGVGRVNENLKGLAGEMGQNGPCHHPCQLSPCSGVRPCGAQFVAVLHALAVHAQSPSW